MGVSAHFQTSRTFLALCGGEFMEHRGLTKATRNNDRLTADMMAATASPLGYWISSSFETCGSWGLVSTSLQPTSSIVGWSSGFPALLKVIVGSDDCRVIKELSASWLGC